MQNSDSAKFTKKHILLSTAALRKIFVSLFALFSFDCVDGSHLLFIDYCGGINFWIRDDKYHYLLIAVMYYMY